MKSQKPRLEDDLQALYSEPLSESELAEACSNLVGFFGVLVEIDKEVNNASSNRSADNPHITLKQPSRVCKSGAQ